MYIKGYNLVTISQHSLRKINGENVLRILDLVLSKPMLAPITIVRETNMKMVLTCNLNFLQLDSFYFLLDKGFFYQQNIKRVDVTIGKIR